MAKDPVDGVVSTITSACNRVERIILFGSRARGDNRARSDIDIAVACPRASQREWLDICDVVDDADTLLPVDVVRLDTAGEPIKSRILREGRVLSAVDALHIEFLAGPDVVLLADFGREHDLAFGGHGRCHGG